MNVGRVYIPKTFITRGTDPSTMGIGARDECWEGVKRSYPHGEEYRPLDTGYRGTR